MHEELIAEIERAEVGSRVLDEKIRLLLVARRLAEGNDGADVRREMGGWSLNDPDSNVPHYSTSLDAALQLVLEGYSWEVRENKFTGESHVWIYRPNNNELRFYGKATTPALALCLACLRARQPATSEADTG